MGIIDNVRSLFSNTSTKKEVKLVEQKENEEVGRLISPVFREIPPNSKAGKFLTEGFRSWAFIAISSIADEICTTKVGLYKKTTDGWDEVEKHPALALIEKPNNFQTKAEFLWLTSIYWLSEGEAPIYLNSPKNPTEMVLLNPERLTVIFDEKNIVGGYNYRQSNGTLSRIPAENVLMLKMPSLTSPFRGAGVMRYIAQTLDIDNYIEEYLKLFFYNDTTPGAVLETEQELTKGIIERLKLQFQNRHQGVKNSHKLSVLEKGMKYHKISSGINELQLKELNDMIRDKVLASFKVPKSVLGIVEDVSRSNAEASSFSFTKRSVQPKLLMIEEQLNQFLLAKFPGTETMEFEFESPVFEDKLLDAQVNQIAINSGWLTVNEVRGNLGLDPLEEEAPEDITGTQEDVEDDNEDEPTKGKYAKPKGTRIREKKRPETLVQIMKDILMDEKPTPKKFYSENELVEFHDKKIMFLDHLEKDYIANLNKHFKKIKRNLLGQIEGKTAKTKGVDINLQIDIEESVDSMVKISSPVLTEAVVLESSLTYALLGLHNTLTPTQDIVKDFIAKRTLKLGKESTQTTQDAVDKIVKDWSERGASWTELRSDLTKYFDDEGTGTRARADMIARTELSNATGFAQQEVYKETGAVGKQWLTSVDERVCPYCDSMNDKYGSGMTVSITENFFNKGDTMPDGTTNDWEAVDTPPLHPNCRCDIIPVYSESKSNKPELIKRYEALRDERLAKEAQEKAIALKEAELLAKEQAIDEKAKMKDVELSIKKNILKEKAKELDEAISELAETKRLL